MRPSRPTRAGFSLIEFLMVLFIICVILIMLLRALGMSREAARRTQCVNNLKQIILALHNYESEHRVLPPGVVNPSGPIRNEPLGLHRSWIVQLMPFMEQSSLYKAIDNDLSVYAVENTTVRMAQLYSLLCPDTGADTPPGPSLGVSSYAACYHDIEAPIDVANHGVFFLNSHITFADIRDGASCTFFVGEKRPDPITLDLGWMSGSRATLRNTGTPINGTPELSETQPASELYVGGYGSRHAGGGANFAFGDGSVRWISEKVEPRILRCLGNRDDGEMISDMDY